MALVLRSLTLADESAFKRGLELFSDMDLDWYSFVYRDGMSFSEHIKILDDRFHGRNLPPNRVADSMLYAFLDGVIIGRSSIRHELNDFLLQRGGHIGYAVASDYRRKGYAYEILKQSLDYCKNVIGLKKVLITCDEKNIPSWKVIEKNGGVLENKINVENEDDEDESLVVKRYWITL